MRTKRQWFAIVLHDQLIPTYNILAANMIEDNLFTTDWSY